MLGRIDDAVLTGGATVLPSAVEAALAADARRGAGGRHRRRRPGVGAAGRRGARRRSPARPRRPSPTSARTWRRRSVRTPRRGSCWCSTRCRWSASASPTGPPSHGSRRPGSFGDRGDVRAVGLGSPAADAAGRRLPRRRRHRRRRRARRLGTPPAPCSRSSWRSRCRWASTTPTTTPTASAARTTSASGPFRLTGSRAAAPGQVRAAAFAAFGVAAVAGLVLTALTGAWWLLAVGAASVAAAWFYTGGPRPYGYAGLGEVFVFVFFGLVAVLGHHLHAGRPGGRRRRLRRGGDRGARVRAPRRQQPAGHPDRRRRGQADARRPARRRRHPPAVRRLSWRVALVAVLVAALAPAVGAARAGVRGRCDRAGARGAGRGQGPGAAAGAAGHRPARAALRGAARRRPRAEPRSALAIVRRERSKRSAAALSRRGARSLASASSTWASSMSSSSSGWAALRSCRACRRSATAALAGSRSRRSSRYESSREITRPPNRATTRPAPSEAEDHHGQDEQHQAGQEVPHHREHAHTAYGRPRRAGPASSAGSSRTGGRPR